MRSMEWMYSVNCSLRVASRGEGNMGTSLRGRGGVWATPLWLVERLVINTISTNAARHESDMALPSKKTRPLSE
jgi:hypothetical protein